MKTSAQIVILNKDGYVLGVSRKTDHKDFGLAGGKMDPEDNGDPKITATRETLEETGLKASNLQLIFAIHKDGYMSYTYLADYEGKINHNEPHVVKWVTFDKLIYGTFGKYNQLVSESLTSMGVKFLRVEPPIEKYYFAIDQTNIIHLTSKTYFDKEKKKSNVLAKEGLEDVYALIENSNINLHDLPNDDIDNVKKQKFMISRKDNTEIKSIEETKELLKGAGFIEDKKFTNYINKQ